MADARRKCEMDKRVHKIGYYKINDEGDQQILCSYTNPDVEDQISNQTWQLMLCVHITA
jgi:hypothetical protein|tara:strand:- start:795 stop:971 length:177 start_codon:yes stop_codon:yes gene_type:complete